MNAQIVDGSRVTLHCRVTDTAANVLDACSQRLVFVCGRQRIIAGLEDRLKGKKAGFQGRIELSPDQAYGHYRKELVFEAVRENLPANLDIQIGMDLSPGGSAGQFNLKVVALTERGAMLDGNHRFAGKHLTFEVEILRVEPATVLSDAPT